MLQLFGPKLVRRQPLDAALDNVHIAFARKEPEIALSRADAARAVVRLFELGQLCLEHKVAAVAVSSVRDGLGFRHVES